MDPEILEGLLRAQRLAEQFKEINQDMDDEKLLDEDFLFEAGEGVKNTQRQQYLTEIHQLKKEIALLETRVQDQENSSIEETAQNILNHLLKLNSESFISHLSHQKENQDDNPKKLGFKLPAIAAFTGIEFTEVSIKPTSTPQGGISRCQYELSGSSHGFFFHVTFTADEETYAVVELKTRVSYQIKRDLAQFIEQVEKENLLPIFFKGFARFAQLRTQRRKIFQGLEERHGDLLTWTDSIDSASSVVIGKRNSGFQVLFVFELQISETGFVTPKIYMLPKSPRQAGIDSGFLQSLPDNFQALADSKGLERALEIFIQATFRGV